VKLVESLSGASDQLLLILDYLPPPRGARRRRIVSAALLGASLPAAASAIAPFTFNDSPWSVVDTLLAQMTGQAPSWTYDWTLQCLAAPFFLGVMIFAWRLRLLIAPATTKAERVAAWILAGIASVSMLTLVGDALIQPPTRFIEWFAFLLSPTILIAGAGTIAIIVRRRGSPHVAPMLAMMLVYSANAVIPLIAFADLHACQIGWYFTIAAVILHVLQMCLVLSGDLDL
jgi:hypothetical protein